MAGMRYRLFGPSNTGVVPSVDMSTDNHRPNGRILVEPDRPFSEGPSPEGSSADDVPPEPSAADPSDDPGVLHCAEHWAAQLRRQGIVDTDAEDLRQEAWTRSRRALATGEVEKPVAFLCKVIERLALMRMRRQRTRPDHTVDPRTGPLALRPARDPLMVELTVRLLLDEVLLFLDRHRDEIWAAMTEVFGETRRAASVWAAARLATTHLIVQANNWSIDETLDSSMRLCDPWWCDPRGEGETSKDAAERHRKRIARDRALVSYIALLEAMRWVWRGHAAACAELVAHHLRHVQIHVREARARRQVERLAALERHIADIEGHVG